MPATPKTIFISRDLEPGSALLSTLGSEGHRVLHQSLIKITQVRFTHTPKTEWIFFSSKNSIRHFFAQQPTLYPGVKFGVMGPNTASCLEEAGFRADFTGQGVDVTQIAKDFAAHIHNQTVLLPQAIDSLQSIQKQLSFTNNCSDLYVYKTTLLTDFNLPPADVLVFTSPSNAAAYFEKYKPGAENRFIAIGSTTGNKLRNYGVKNIVFPKSFDENGLLDVIRKTIDGIS